jgi:DDE domain
MGFVLVLGARIIAKSKRTARKDAGRRRKGACRVKRNAYCQFSSFWSCLQYEPKRIITDGLRSCGVAQCALRPNVKHRTSRYLNNRAENLYRPTRRREQQIQRFKSSSQEQDFLSTHGVIYDHFQPQGHRIAAAGYRRARARAFRIWRLETCVHRAAWFPFAACTLNQAVPVSIKLTMSTMHTGSHPDATTYSGLTGNARTGAVFRCSTSADAVSTMKSVNFLPASAFASAGSPPTTVSQ